MERILKKPGYVIALRVDGAWFIDHTSFGVTMSFVDSRGEEEHGGRWDKMKEQGKAKVVRAIIEVTEQF